ncbi:MAG: NAD+ synthase [Proteobacteria bacterium]|nr:NAD+ synthase [Pseudomonadota bacterium]
MAVFPELALTGYTPMDILDRKDFVLKALDILDKKITPNITGCAVILGSISRNCNKGKPYHNSAFFIEDKKIISVINKQLLPTYDLFDERRYYQEGQNSFPVNYKGLKLGIHICEDMWRKESEAFQKLYKIDPVDNLGEQGVDIFINISASPFARGKDKIRENLMKRYISKWNVPFILVNTVGANDSIVFDGQSKYISSEGKVLIEAKDFEEDLVIVDTEKEPNTKIIKDSDTETVYKALILGLKDYVRKNGFKGIVIGVSGGIDSALCAALAKEAVGARNVTCVTMPTRFSSKGSVVDSQKLCKNLGVEFIKIPIEDIFNRVVGDINSNAKPDLRDMALENLQPRIRGTILMAFSNSRDGRIVIAPGNKSEIATGYCTLYGDTCGALALIGDIYKTEVYELCKFINRNKEIIPKEIMQKKPSAELRHQQYDTDTLPAYDALDEVLKLYVEKEISPEEIYKKVSMKKEIVDFVINLVIKSEFKRKQLPPVIKVSEKSFILDRRWPIVHKFR